MTNEVFWELITNVLMILIQVLVPYALVVLVRWLNAKSLEAKAYVQKNELEVALQIVWQLVHAAEQNGLKQQLSNFGKDKKAWVMATAQAYLDARGITIPLAELDALVESQVNMAFEKLVIPEEFQAPPFKPTLPSA